MRAVIEVIKRKDSEDYMRLGNLALKVNKDLSRLRSIAYCHCSCWVCLCRPWIMGGDRGSHSRNCAGFFILLEESIESTIQEKDLEEREDGEISEMNVALKLGRSLSQLRDLARKPSSSSHLDGSTIDEFASKLF
ncbi:hypothetical protein OIU84_002203 [Salix udensis]|uniref:Uncharacterized protein n=1 Tax=Salix udensis TaxID=889485 RepID=A0AAD6P532_9ROSI|nr:hypothetical protein OIU84_002203 [Salix udensis]